MGRSKPRNGGVELDDGSGIVAFGVKGVAASQGGLRIALGDRCQGLTVGCGQGVASLHLHGGLQVLEAVHARLLGLDFRRSGVGAESDRATIRLQPVVVALNRAEIASRASLDLIGLDRQVHDVLAFGQDDGGAE
ncbi:hypothetical protein D3C85_965690 [compost metagenome]